MGSKHKGNWVAKAKKVSVRRRCMGYAIKKNVPIPQIIHPSRQKWISLLRNMEIGDCVELKTKKECQCLNMAARRYGAKIGIRCILTGFLVWRLK